MTPLEQEFCDLKLHHCPKMCAKCKAARLRFDEITKELGIYKMVLLKRQYFREMFR